MFGMLFQPYPVYFFHSMPTPYIHVHLSLYFTYSLGRFLTTLNLHVQIRCFILLFRCSMRVYMLRGAGVSLFVIIGIPVLLFMLFPDSLYIVSSYLFISYSYVISCGYLYVVLQ